MPAARKVSWAQLRVGVMALAALIIVVRAGFCDVRLETAFRAQGNDVHVYG